MVVRVEIDVLRRYVRASMSLSGYLPPLCDEGKLLLDGGYMNNLPADIVRSFGADTIFAIDVASEENKKLVNYGDSLSGWYALLQSFNPFYAGTAFMSLADVQSRLAFVSCAKQLEDVKNMENCFYLRPPVGHYGTLDFGRFDEIYEAGYKYGKEVVKKWESEGKLKQWQPAARKSKVTGRRNSI